MNACQRIIAEEIGVESERLGKIAVALARAKKPADVRSAALAARITCRAIGALGRQLRTLPR